MRPTESAAHCWLVSQGYAPNEITFQYASSPDFVTPDGKGWEVKRPVCRVAFFGVRQIADLRRFEGDPSVLFWADGGTEPFAIAAFNELTIPGKWNELTMRATWQPGLFGVLVPPTVEAVDAVVARYAAQGYRRRALGAYGLDGRRLLGRNGDWGKPVDFMRAAA